MLERECYQTLGATDIVGSWDGNGNWNRFMSPDLHTLYHPLPAIALPVDEYLTLLPFDLLPSYTHHPSYMHENIN